MATMSWRDAILKVLFESKEAMHYSDIAEKIVESGLRKKVGATPAATVNANISTSLKEEGNKSPFIRVGRGEYFLKHVDISNAPADSKTGSDKENNKLVEDESERNSIINAYGMYWQRDRINWTDSKAKLWGKQQKGADRVNFFDQRGIYLLHDRDRVIYVGRIIERPLGQRLKEHTQDRHSGRWNRFSWFGIKRVTEKGKLEEAELCIDPAVIIETLEAVLIEGLEPSQNRRIGDGFREIEYIQVDDPVIRHDQFMDYMKELQKTSQ